MAQTRNVGGRTQYFWNGNWHTVPQPKPFKPFQTPTAPPTSYYDIGLDQQLAAATRGNQDQHQDIETATSRGSQDFATATARLAQSRDQTLADLLVQRQDVQRGYQNLASAQRDRANAMGVYGSSGWDQGAAQVRAANEAHDVAPIDTAQQRLVDPNTGTYANSLADLVLAHQRGGEDLTTQGARGDRELGFYGTDVAATRFAQAAQAGWTPPAKPKNENTKNGVTYRRLPDGRAQLASTGRTVSAAQLRQIIKRGR